MSASYSGRLRSTSVSSMRSTKTPSFWRAKSTLYSAVLAVPRCAKPVGLGAILTRTDTAISYGRVWTLTGDARAHRGRRVPSGQRRAGPRARRRGRTGTCVRRPHRRGAPGTGPGGGHGVALVRPARPDARGAARLEEERRQLQGGRRTGAFRRVFLPGRRRPGPGGAGADGLARVARDL